MNKSSSRFYISRFYPLVDMETLLDREAKIKALGLTRRWTCPHLSRPKTSACTKSSSKAGIRNHIRRIHPKDKKAEPVETLVGNPPWAVTSKRY